MNQDNQKAKDFEELAHLAGCFPVGWKYGLLSYHKGNAAAKLSTTDCGCTRLFQVRSLVYSAYVSISAANKSETDSGASAGVCLAGRCEGLSPEPGTTSEKKEEKTVTMGNLRSFYLTIKDNQLLTQQRIFDYKVRSAAGQIR